MTLFCRIAVFALFLVLPALLVAAPVDFVRDVRPIFQKHCYECHGEKKQKSELRLDIKELALKGGDTHQPDIIAGKAEQSPLIHLVTSADVDERMPAEGDALSAGEIAILKAWIDQGALWPDGVDLVELEDPRDHWAFKPLPEQVLPPVIKNQSWGSGDLDVFILARLMQEGLKPSAAADRRTWLRRVTFDLTGLPPTPQQMESYLNDKSTRANKAVVDRLLASPRYGERWAQHWLDVVRYADTHGFEVNTSRTNAWPYRDYVIEAFNQDTPYDQFIREQLAGDTMGKDAATGFLVTAAVLLPGQIGKDDASKRLARQDELGEIVINTGEAFLGLSIGCARCHDHKFDPISAQDYYSMQAFFAGVKYGDRAIKSPEADAVRKEAAKLKKQATRMDLKLAAFVPIAQTGAQRPAINPVINKDRFVPVKTKAIRFTIKKSNNPRKTNNVEPCIDELEVFNTAGVNVALKSAGAKSSASGSIIVANRHGLEKVNDGRYGNAHSWMSNQKDGGWVRIDFAAEHNIDRVVWGRDREGKFNDRLAIEYVIEVLGTSGQWRVVADSSDRKKYNAKIKKPTEFTLLGLSPEETRAAKALKKEKKALESRIKKLNNEALVYGGIFGEPEGMFLLRRGDPEQPKAEVSPSVIRFLGDLELAKTSTDAQRRAALADWVASPGNVLTARVMVNRIWQGHFGIGLVETSNDFGRAGVKPTHPELLDWLARKFIESGWSIKAMHRMIILSSTYGQSSGIRAAAQAKDADVRLLWRFPSRRVEGESIRDTMLAVSGRLNLKMGGSGFDMFKSRGGLSGFPPVESYQDEGRRRMIYAHKIRMEREAVFGAFDCPDAGQTSARRRQSTTPLQALNLFNSRFTMDESAAFAKRIEAEIGSDLKSQIQRIYQLAYGREANAIELEDASALVSSNGLPALCRAIYNSSEFIFIP
ncbi:MAG: PSD1 and planctomycete cytochrome C domain-containing protein [Verrucomicrobiota bacterium]